MKPRLYRQAEPSAALDFFHHPHASKLPPPSDSRRAFLRRLALGVALFTVPGAFAEELVRKTAWVEEGPFYRSTPTTTSSL